MTGPSIGPVPVSTAAGSLRARGLAALVVHLKMLRQSSCRAVSSRTPSNRAVREEVVAVEVAAAVGIVIDLTKSYGVIITLDYLRLLPVNGFVILHTKLLLCNPNFTLTTTRAHKRQTSSHSLASRTLLIHL